MKRSLLNVIAFVETSRAISMFLSIAATLATMSVCSAQSIEIAELTDETLQIDGTVMYVNGAALDAVHGVVDRVTVEEYPLDADFISAASGADGYSNTTNMRDIVYGGPSGDTISGGKGVSWLYGEGGEDILYGGLGNDLVNGGDQFRVDIKIIYQWINGKQVAIPTPEDTLTDFNAGGGDSKF